MKIRAAILERPRSTFSIASVELETGLRGREILVHIVACGVCHTDLLVRDEGMPFPLPGVLGHEGTGVVESVGPHVESIRAGDHVLLTFPADGTCANCLSGHPRWCYEEVRLLNSGRRYDGSPSALSRNGAPLGGHFFQSSAYATYAVATEMNAVVVAPDVPLDLFVIGCGVMTGAGGVLNTLRPAPDSSIAIFGAGGVGCSALMAAVVAQCNPIIAVEPNESRRAIARELGATHTLDPHSGDPVEAIRKLCKRGVDHSLVAVGNQRVPTQAVAVLKSGGTCGIIGDPGAGIEASYEIAKLVTGGKRIQGIIGGDAVAQAFLPLLISLHGRGRFPLERIVRRYPFDQINEAVRDAESGKTIKPILIM